MAGTSSKWGKFWLWSLIWPWRSRSITPQYNRDLNQGLLHLQSKFTDPSLNGWWVIARTSRCLLHTRTDGHTDRQTQATTISEGQNWPRVMKRNVHSSCTLCGNTGWNWLEHRYDIVSMFESIPPLISFSILHTCWFLFYTAYIIIPTTGLEFYIVTHRGLVTRTSITARSSQFPQWCIYIRMQYRWCRCQFSNRKLAHDIEWNHRTTSLGWFWS